MEIKYLKKNKLLLFIYGVFSLITFILLTLIFTSYSWITDTALARNLAEGKLITLQVILFLLGMLVFLIIMSIVERYLLYNVSKSLREDLVNKLFNLDYNTFYEKDSSYYLSMIVNDIDTLENEYYGSLISIIGEILQLMVMLLFIGRIDVKYVLIILLLTVPSLIQPFILKKRIGLSGLESSKAMTRYNDKANEYIYGMEEIKTSNNSNIFQKKFKDDVFKLENTRYDEKFLTVLNFILSAITVYFLKLSSLIIFVNDVVNKLIVVAIATALFGYANNVGNPISSIIDYYGKINGSKNVKEKVEKFLNKKDLYNKPLNQINNIENIFLEGLNFSFGENLILKNISYEFSEGHKYAIFGDSGSGKSTLIKLIMGFYKTYNGGIKFDNIDVKDIENSSLWEEICYIPQSGFIMSGTLKDNISLFSNRYSEEEINKVIEISDLNEVIDSLENGINTYIGEGGKNFSGGEKQRICLARGLLSDKPILLLDESFSALDNKKAIEIEKRILGLNKTIIGISHRANDNLYMYDNILVLKDGEIIENGKYRELYKEGTYFYNLIGSRKEEKIDEKEQEHSHKLTSS